MKEQKIKTDIIENRLSTKQEVKKPKTFEFSWYSHTGGRRVYVALRDSRENILIPSGYDME